MYSRISSLNLFCSLFAPICILSHSANGRWGKTSGDRFKKRAQIPLSIWMMNLSILLCWWRPDPKGDLDIDFRLTFVSEAFDTVHYGRCKWKYLSRFFLKLLGELSWTNQGLAAENEKLQQHHKKASKHQAEILQRIKQTRLRKKACTSYFFFWPTTNTCKQKLSQQCLRSQDFCWLTTVAGMWGSSGDAITCIINRCQIP